MKLNFLIFLIGFILTLISAFPPPSSSSWILFYGPDGGKAMAEAKDIIRQAGGRVLYEYSMTS
jgi:hypothetical protein